MCYKKIVHLQLASDLHELTRQVDKPWLSHPIFAPAVVVAAVAAAEAAVAAVGSPSAAVPSSSGSSSASAPALVPLPPLGVAKNGH